MKRLSRISSFLYFPIILFSLSCSLKYSETINSEDRVPEFVFEETDMIRYEADKPTLEVSAGLLEQYKDSNSSYAKDITFKSYDKEGKLTTEGSCGLLYADTDKKIYELYDGINLYNVDEKMRFYANSLLWNERTEQLISGRGDMVKVEKDDTVMRGSGFSASGISKSFSFKGNVVGTIETSEEEEKTENENKAAEEIK